MNREFYDLFEIVKRRPRWRGRAEGLLAARVKLLEISRETSNELVAMHLPDQQVAARINACIAGGNKPVIIQISYDHTLTAARTKALRLRGYEVSPIVGNEAAKLLLTNACRRCDLFIVGHAAPDRTRREMVAWLRLHFPAVPILALNRPEAPELRGADFNLKLNGPETWLPVIARALGHAFPGPDRVSFGWV